MAVAGLHAATARADCAPFSRPLLTPFDGLSIPANAELRVIVIGDVVLTSPDGTSRTVGVVDDELGQRLDIDVRTLAPGPYRFATNDGIEGTFELRADDDTEPPAAPVVSLDVTTTVTGPRPPIFDDCGPSPGIRRAAHFYVEGGEPGDLVVVNGRIVGMGDTVVTGVGDDSEFAVSLRDLAGNEGDATVVPIEGGCGGCTSAAFSPFWLALLALLRRRRPAPTKPQP